MFDDNFIVEMKKKLRDRSKKNPRYIQFASSSTEKEWWYVYHERNEFFTGHPSISRMKSLMGSFVHWRRIDRNIERLYKGFALTTKAPPIKFKLWAETDCPLPCLHIDFAGPLNGSYYLIVVDNFSKWPEILRCKKLNTGVVNGFARFGFPDSFVLDNATQFTSKEFKGFCKMFAVERITISRQAERFMGTFEWARRNPRWVHGCSIAKFSTCVSALIK